MHCAAKVLYCIDKQRCYIRQIKYRIETAYLYAGRRLFYCYKKEFYDVKTFFMRDPTVAAG